MGIQGLTKLITDNASGALKENDMKNYFGRVVAVDASMSLYQFMIAVRPDDLGQFTLTNDAGETTRRVSGARPTSSRRFSAAAPPSPSPPPGALQSLSHRPPSIL